MTTREHFGSEPPEGSGWKSAGAGKWVKSAPTVGVIGGGPGGLFAAYILNQRCPDAEVVLYEASDRLGGKILTDRFDDGTPFEAGVAELYEYLGPGGKDPLRLLIEDDLGLHTVDMSGGGLLIKGEAHPDWKTLPPETQKTLRYFHECCAELMPLEKYANRWQPDNAHPWANQTFRDCIRAECEGDLLAVECIEAAVASDLATESHTCNGLNGLKNVLLDNDRYMQLFHVVGGIGQITDRLAELIRADLQTEARATAVARSPDGCRISYRQHSRDKSRDFDAVVVAVPNHWLSQIRFDPPELSEAVHRIVAHYDLPAHYLRISLLFREAFWKRLGMPGEFWMCDIFNGCCVYDESARWKSRKGHVLSFLLAGQDALLMCSANQSDEEIVEHLLDALPEILRGEAQGGLIEAQVDRYVGSINAQPGGWPAPELRGVHQPCEECPGVCIAGDYVFDSTLNGALISSYTAVDCLLDYLGVEKKPGTKAIRQLEPDGDVL